MRDTEEQFERRLLPLFVNRGRKVGGSSPTVLRWGGATAPVSVPVAWDGEGVDFVLWHMARVEDNWVQGFGRGVETVWENGGWAARLGLPEQGNGWGYTVSQVGELPQFDLDLLNEYAAAFRAGTIGFLDGLSSDDLDRVPDPTRPEVSIGSMLSHVIVEESQHVGQAAYLRGIQRGLDQ